MSWHFEQSPIAYDYLEDRSVFAGIIGPVGSGKTIPSNLRIQSLGQEQQASPDGIRRSRFAIIRNTMPELRATTMESYKLCYPEPHLGKIIHRSPAEHKIAVGDCEILVNFIAMDKPQDVKRLLSLEITGAFLNEWRELPRAVLNRIGERTGRYLLNERPTTWSGVWADTNPPDSDHYIFGLDQTNRPQGWNILHQPPGVLMVRETQAGPVVDDPSFPHLEGRRISEGTVYQPNDDGSVTPRTFPTEVIHAADRAWIVNPDAENLIALQRINMGSNPLGAMSYYGRALAGKTVEEIQVYLQGVYAFHTDGKRVVPNYHAATHSRDHVEPVPDAEIYVNCDIGGGTLQPSAIFMQRHPRGPILCLAEIVCTDASGVGSAGVKRFGELIVQTAARLFPDHVAKGLVKRGWGDPAGVGRDEIFEVASFDYLRAEFGIELSAAPTQDPKLRAAALIEPCARLHEQVAGLLVSRSRCPMLHKGLMGQWYYKRLQVVGSGGEVMHADKPVKNDYSHPCDAAAYGALGMGEFAMLGAHGKQGYSVIVPPPSSGGGGAFGSWPEI